MRRQHLHRVGIERQYHRRPIGRFGPLHHIAEQGAMAEMLAVEIPDGENRMGDSLVCGQASRDFHTIVTSRQGLSSFAASLAKYVRIMSAPARLIASSDSIIARDSSSHPARAAALIILYSPLT